MGDRHIAFDRIESLCRQGFDLFAIEAVHLTPLINEMVGVVLRGKRSHVLEVRDNLF